METTIGDHAVIKTKTKWQLEAEDFDSKVKELMKKRMDLEIQITTKKINEQLGKRLIDDICLEIVNMRLKRLR